MVKEVIEAPLYDHTGGEKGKRQLPAGVFLQEVNENVIHQVIRAYLSNRRRCTVSTKNRALVSGGGKKPWRQKGTGRARAGTIRSPLWRGGGMTFNLSPRNFRLKITKRMKRMALYSALSQKARDEAIKVFESFEFSAPRTREMAELLARVGISEKKVLILTDEVNKFLYLSGRNIPRVVVYPFKDISALEIMHADVLLIEDSVVETLEAAEKVK